MWLGRDSQEASRHFPVQEADTTRGHSLGTICGMTLSSKAQVRTADRLSFQHPPTSSGRVTNLEQRKRNGLENLP